jgi:hypothetical protein
MLNWRDGTKDTGLMQAKSIRRDLNRPAYGFPVSACYLMPAFYEVPLITFEIYARVSKIKRETI